MYDELSHIVFVGLGSNLKDRKTNIYNAIKWLESRNDIKIIAHSELIETKPWGVEEQPCFINAVVKIKTSLLPHDLLSVLKTGETQLGREPGGLRWGPRIIDMDILLYDDAVIDSDNLTVPHPRLTERRFVMEQIVELDNSAYHPQLRRTILSLLSVAVFLIILSCGRANTAVIGDSDTKGSISTSSDYSTEQTSDNVLGDSETESTVETDLFDTLNTDEFVDTESDSVNIDDIIVDCNGPIVFPDDKLDAAVRSQTGIVLGDLMPEDLQSLVMLNAENMDIGSINGIQCLTGLKFLNLKKNNIQDISPLNELTLLQRLDLGMNRIENLSALSHMNNLEILDLSDNMVVDLSDVAAMSKLTFLDLTFNSVKELSPLSSMTQLTHLYLYDNKIEDISPISALVDLVHLTLSTNRISDISPIANLNKLTVLTLSFNPIKDVSYVKNLIELRVLRLEDTNISDISWLANFRELIDLNLSKNKLGNINLIKDMKKLDKLYLTNNMITDIAPIADNLDLTENNIVRIDNNKLDCLNSIVIEQIAEIKSRGVMLVHDCD